MSGKKENMIATALVKGIGTCILITVCGAMIIASYMITGKIGERGTDAIIYAILALASFCGSVITKRCGGIRLLAIATAAGLVTVLMICGLLVFEGSLGRIWMHLAAVASGGALALVIPAKKAGRKKRRKPLSC